MRVLNKERESEDPDVANLETIRPRDVADPLMDVSRRSYGLTPAARANYEETFPDHEKTDVEKKLESAEADKMASLLARIEELETRASLKESKRKKRSERMKNQWAEKRAKAKGALDVAEAS